MHRRFSFLRPMACLALAVLALAGCQRPAGAEPAPANKAQAKEDAATTDKWVRLHRDKDGNPLSLQVAVGRFVPAKDYVPGKPAGDYQEYVDLVGAVHIADHAYYDGLNQRFKTYDRVLFELVAPEGTVVPKGRGTSNDHPLGAIQNGMKNLLEVEHQLEQVDYTQPNFVHADLSPDEFMKSMEDREETFTKMYFKLIGASLANQSQQAAEGQNAGVDMFAALFSDDRPRLLKIAMAEQFESMESLLVGFAGPEGSTLITARNTRAIDVLEKELEAGNKRLAIFYGAGHLSDMQKQLEKRADMKYVSRDWLDAWDLRAD